MAIRGARPKPTVVKLVTNTARRKNEPRAARRGLPKPPKYLDEGEERPGTRWSETSTTPACSRSPIGRSSPPTARPSLAGSDAELALQAARAKDDTGSFGLLIEGRKGMVLNPLVGAANRTMLIVSRLCVELGMTPSSRSRVCALSEVEEEDPASKYID